MSRTAIRVEGLGKQYKIGELQRYETIRDVLTESLKAPFRALRKGGRGERNQASRSEEGSRSNKLWALRGVSFEVAVGEVLGLIGGNGAGKTTLLKALSRITEPTEGLAEIHGRVGSLLEVGTGFHPELTGRENIYLNGAILGMRRHEIDRNFDEIVDFAEIEKFLDTPVKRYSSGMFVRLAFAVAAHLETEVLFVDEVLAVGDARFQRKCLGKMDAVAKEGRTVIFVSHSMSSVLKLCSRGLLLERGHLVYDGPAEEAVSHYMGDRVGSTYQDPGRGDKPRIRKASAEWSEEAGIQLDILVDSPFPLNPPVIGLVLFDMTGVPIFGTNPRFDDQPGAPESFQNGQVRVTISDTSLRSGRYAISLWLGDHFTDYVHLDKALMVRVGIAADEAHRPSRALIGSTFLETTWRYEEEEEDSEHETHLSQRPSI